MPARHTAPLFSTLNSFNSPVTESNHLLRLYETAAPQNGFMQNAIEHGIVTGLIQPTGHLPVDVKLVGRHYDDLAAAYRRHLANTITALQPAFDYAAAA